MTQRDNILQELRELQSSLADAGAQNVYQVPGGYFDGLAEQVLNRIKALNTEDAAEELNYLSPLLSGISKQMPYSVPAGFFDGLAESVIASVNTEAQTPAEELEELSPLLSGLKKEMPFSIPKDYFEKLDSSRNTKEVKPVAKVVSITSQKWFRYAAAAVVIGFVAMSGLLLFNRNGSIDPKTESTEWVMKNTKKIDTATINSFVKLADEGVGDVAVVDVRSQIRDKNEVQELIKDIADKDIEDFLEDTQEDESNNSEDVLMN
ncbi:MAG: hypothetical protein ACHQFX_09085 [Chitinophagales bacterium]